jgi:hypothetical protein
LSGEGSARKASVTPRMGSLAAGSTWPNSDAMDLDAGRSGPLRRCLIAAAARDMAMALLNYAAGGVRASLEFVAGEEE